MNRYSGLSVVPISFGLLSAAPASAASMTQVNRSTWTSGANLPSYTQMYIYVPDKLAANPPIVVSAHSCGNSAEGQFGAITKTRAAADQNGFIIILPDNPGQNCWDVGSKQSMTHDGGGDTHAVAQMVRYALNQYKGDPERVYVFGGSSGAMMTQALLGVYPELFIAGAARAGVPCGCWAESYDPGQQWSGPCAGGSVSKTAQQWGDYVRAINPSYDGHRPRVQLYQGQSDSTISYNNMGEAIKEWTNVLGLSTTPTSTDSISSSGYTYNRQFWENDCGYVVLEAWSAPGQGHSMSYEEDAILKFFGLDTAGGSDPELAACSGGGGAGTGGASGTGGTTATGGASGNTGGVGGAAGGGGGVGPTGGRGPVGGRSSTGGTLATGGRGGSSATGGNVPNGGTSVTTGGTGPTGGFSATGGLVGSGGGAVVGSGGTSATGGFSATGGMVATGGTYATGGSAVPGSGGAAAAGGTVANGGAGAPGGSSGIPGTADDTGSEGCGCRLGRPAGGSAGATALLAALLGVVLRRRKGRARC